jgi:signal transduction histidine kinase
VRLSRDSQPGAAGAGIGLAVVHELVAAQRGRAWVERGSRGGARFVLELPGGAADDGNEPAASMGDDASTPGAAETSGA